MKKDSRESPLPFLQEGPEGCLLKILLRPRSTRERIVGVQGDCLKISVNAPPVEGKANEACLRFLAGQLGLRRSQLSVQGGHRSPHKLIAISACPAQALQERLISLLGA